MKKQGREDLYLASSHNVPAPGLLLELLIFTTTLQGGKANPHSTDVSREAPCAVKCPAQGPDTNQCWSWDLNSSSLSICSFLYHPFLPLRRDTSIHLHCESRGLGGVLDPSLVLPLMYN